MSGVSDCTNGKQHENSGQSTEVRSDRVGIQMLQLEFARVQQAWPSPQRWCDCRREAWLACLILHRCPCTYSRSGPAQKQMSALGFDHAEREDKHNILRILPSLSCPSQPLPLIPLPGQSTSAHHLRIAWVVRLPQCKGAFRQAMQRCHESKHLGALTQRRVLVSRCFPLLELFLEPGTTLIVAPNAQCSPQH